MACVDLPAFPLQILLRREPAWSGLPAAVIDQDRPQGLLLWVNETARAARVLSGMRYAAALSLCRELRAGVVPPTEIETETESLMQRLRFFSPEVERTRKDPGTFWAGVDGLELLHPSLVRWAELVRLDLRQAGYDGRVAVGFSRFGSYAAARATREKRVDDPSCAQTVVFRDAREEQAAVRGISIDRIACDPEFRDTLARLGIHELGGFIDLPPAGVRRRFGAEAYTLHRMARGDAWDPLAPEIPEEPHEQRIVLDAPETDTTRLLHAIERGLQDLLARLRARDRVLSALMIDLGFDRPGPDGRRRRTETLRPAKPTRELGLLLDLVRLRLESVRLSSGVMDLRLEISFLGGEMVQGSLFPDRSRRDLDAANRALARVRAEFGEAAVSVARLRDAHLPEARFALEPMVRLAEAAPRKTRTPPLVRRILNRPEPLVLRRPATVVTTDGDTPLGLRIPGTGTIMEAAGPFAVSGGWWGRPTARQYWYVRVEPEVCAPSRGAGAAPGASAGAGNTGETRAADSTNGAGDADSVSGVWLWIYRDLDRQRWFRQGEVE
jgi:protein ImuB